MPQENIFSGSLAHKIGQRMMAIITHAPKGERTRLGEARRLGISYVIEYASPGLSDNEPTLKARRYAVNLVLGRMFGTGDVVRPDLAARLVTFEYMFPFASPEIQRQYGANFQRFCLLRIPDYSFDDLDVLLKPIRRNSYDFGYELRDALNDAP